MGCVRIKLNTVCVIVAANMSCKFDDRNLHTKAESKVWDIVLSCVAGCKDLALNAADTESTRNKDTIYIVKNAVYIIGSQFLGIHPLDIDGCMERDSTML